MVGFSFTPLVKNTNARSSAVNALFTAVATAFATIPAAAVINEGRTIYCEDSGAANAYVVAMPVTLTAYTAGLTLRVLIATGNSNTGASTINVDGLGTKNIIRADGATPESNDIRAGQVIEITYDGTQFVLVGFHGSNVLTGVPTPVSVPNGGTGVATLTSGGILLGSGTGNLTAMAVLGDGEIVVGDGVTNPVALAAFTSSTGVLKHESGGIEFDASAVDNGDLIVGTASGTMALRADVFTDGEAGFLKHEVGGIEANISAIANGGIVVGTATGTMALRANVFTDGAAGFLKHEVGGIEADISLIADGGILVGTGAGTMAVRAGVLTAGAAGFLKHEVGGLEADVSAYDGLVHITGGVTSAKAIGTDVQAYSDVTAALASVMSSTATVAAQRAALGVGRKNLIDNPEMAVDQRSAETRTGLGASGAYHIDRWKYEPSGSPTGRFTLANTAVPSLGVRGSIKCTVTTADAALDAAALYLWTQYVEAQNLQHLNYGQSDAKSITVSFWADAPAGNYTFKVLSQDASRTYATAFALAGAGLEKVTITVPGDTSGGITNDTGRGLQFIWTMAGGSNFQGGTVDAWTAEANNTYAAGNNVNMFDTGTNVFQLAKVQVEVGSVATDFEHEDITETERKCHRRYYRATADTDDHFGPGFGESTTQMLVSIDLPVVMPSDPVLTTTGTATDYRVQTGSAGNVACSSVPTINNAGRKTVGVRFTTAGSLAADEAGQGKGAASGAWLGFSAEL